MAFITPIDIPTLIKDFQRIVVELKESDRINHSLAYAHRVADIIQRRSGDTPLRHIPGQDFETEHKENRNRQLRDLDTENRQLRQLYEDAQWTLHLVMESHRRELESHFGHDNALSLPSERQNDAETNNIRQKFYQNAALMARGVNEVLQHEKRMNEAFAQRIRELEVENEVLRCVLESRPGVDVDAVIDRLEQRMLLSSTGSLGDISTNSSADFEYHDNQDVNATPVKKKSKSSFATSADVK
ncbi:hypothetical protein NECAME_00136 [Necator americanus]|uniref:Uncharacterized protein n=1 Tax=Necator americanus TaxID=51031 RepID=W2U1T8_NECAM|nr:hypothetical protein NECAME_00136 [Necator americanus]ETN87277.1 hypothetical protein NECAME_00136 [Necator americanus]